MERLISDGGEMTVGRRTASWVWGRFDVSLASGQAQAEDDGRIVDGFIYRPDVRESGLFDLTFVRADARLDMDESKSDLEETLDGASKRTEGGSFYTRTIRGEGLAGTRPGVDYRIGDVVEVSVWGRYMELPVTGITASSSLDEPIGWDVQVGGQMTRDAEALRKRNSALESQIAAEKRARLKDSSEVRTAVDEEQDQRTAQIAEAIDKISRIQERLLGEQNRELRATRTTPMDIAFGTWTSVLTVSPTLDTRYSLSYGVEWEHPVGAYTEVGSSIHRIRTLVDGSLRAMTLWKYIDPTTVPKSTTQRDTAFGDEGVLVLAGQTITIQVWIDKSSIPSGGFIMQDRRLLSAYLTATEFLGD